MLIEPAEIKILLAEDAKTMRRIEIESLKKLGFTNVIEANDGAEAMELLKKETVDLIISDWNMPNKSGYDLLEWVRADENFKDVPFIMATAQSDKNYLKQAEEAGVTGFIPKPFSNDELKRTIDRVFGEEEETEEIIDNKIDGKIKLKIAHIQITDHLVLGVLKDMIDKGDLTPKYFDLETVRMSGWNSVLSDLEDGKVDAACVLAPIAMDLYSANVPIKLILLAHKSGSVLVRNKLNSDFEDSEVNFFRNKSFIIPHKMSVHHMLTDIFFKGIGLNPNLDKGDEYDIELEVAAPVNMPKFLKNNQLNSGFMVAEPIGANAISKDIADLQFYTNELWENHPCCVIAARDEFLEMETDAAYELTEMLVKAGKLIKSDPDRASEIALSFLDPEKKLGLKTEIIKKVITDPNGIKTDDLFPVIDDLEEIMHYMHKEMGIGSIIDLEEFVDLRFAYRACDDDDRTISNLIKSPEELNYLLTKKELPAEEEDLITSFTPSPEDLETSNEDQIQDSELIIPLDDPFEEEEVLQEEVLQEEVPQEEVLQEEVLQEEVLQEEVLQEEVLQEEVSQEEVLQEEVSQEEQLACEGKYLTFSLENQEYGIDILKIKEIIGMMNISVLPQMPHFMKGVINLRDQVIPIMDLRTRFGMIEADYTERTCIIILEVLIDNSAKNIGVIVDSVSEVLPIDNSELEKTPSFGHDIDTNYILAMAKKQDSVKTLLNIEEIVH